jgi:hypothetical protein
MHTFKELKVPFSFKQRIVNDSDIQNPCGVSGTEQGRVPEESFKKKSSQTKERQILHMNIH